MGARHCVVPHTHSSFDKRSLDVAGPCVWNGLPLSLPQDISYEQFKQLLKTILSSSVWELVDHGTM